MYLKLWRLLAPFHRNFYKLILIMIVYETCQVFFSYTISGLVRLFELNVQLTIWFLCLIFLMNSQELFMRLDNRLDWQIILQSHEIYKNLKINAVIKFLKLDRAWQQRHNSGTLIGQISEGIWKTLSLVDGCSWEFMPTLIQTIISIIPLLFVSFPTAILCAISLLSFIILTWRGEIRKGVLRKARHDQYDLEWKIAVQAVQAHETTVMFGQQERLVADLTVIHDKIIQIAHQEHKAGIFFFNRWRIRMLNLTRAAIFVFWVWQLSSGSIDVPGLIFVSILSEKLLSSFWRFARLADNVTNNSEGVRRLIDLMSENEPISTGTSTPDFSKPAGIEIKDVCFGYSGDYDKDSGALHKLSFEIKPKTITAIVGPSGAGKTTIRKVITGLWPIQSGKIFVQDRDIKEYDQKELLKLFTYVPQGDDVFIWDETVLYNIRFGRPDASREEAQLAAELAGIHNFILTLDKGYDSIVGERGIRLSGGQKQRIALARAILADREIMILDEATSAVDSITEEEIQSNMKTILKGKTAVVIAHRLSTVKMADKIVVMDKGEVLEQGTHLELMAKNGLYAQMVTLQKM